jgi:adenylate kinase
LLGRAEIEGRADDSESTIRERMRVYDAETAPLVEFYRSRDRLFEVSGMGNIEEVGKRVRQALGA